MHPYYDRTRKHWHSETLTSLSWLSLARTLGPNQRLELAGARHGAGNAKKDEEKTQEYSDYRYGLGVTAKQKLTPKITQR